MTHTFTVKALQGLAYLFLASFVVLGSLHYGLAPVARGIVKADHFFFGAPHASAEEPLKFGVLPFRKITLRIPQNPPTLPQDAGKGGKRDYSSFDPIPVLKQAGFKGESLKMAYAVSRAESGHNPDAFNPVGKDLSYGMFQINMLGRLGPARRKQFGLKKNEDLYDPLTNAKAAYAISNGGKNWRPWGAYTNGSYRQFLTAFDSLHVL